jgi:pseudouridine kinase
MSGRVCCIGGINLDEIVTLAQPARPGTSNPAARQTARGGVARNVAENLARLGAAVSLVGLVGDDAAGAALRQESAAAGIDVAGVEILAGEASGRYTAVLQPDGRLLIGLAAIQITDRLTPARLQRHAAALARADWIFADANLPADSLTWLPRARRRGRLAIDAVSSVKAERLPAELGGIDLLFCNRDEAAAILGGTAGPADDMARGLIARGAAAAVVSSGAGGLAWATRDQVGILAVPPVGVVDETGAGDALVAGTLHGLLRNEPLSRACRLGIAAAALTLAVRGPCNDALSPAALARAGCAA